MAVFILKRHILITLCKIREIARKVVPKFSGTRKEYLEDGFLLFLRANNYG